MASDKKAASKTRAKPSKAHVPSILPDRKKTKDQLVEELALLRGKHLMHEKSASKHKVISARLQMLWNGISDAVFVHEITSEGRPGKFIDVNDEACRRLGYSRNELLAMSPYDICDKDFELDLGAISKKLSRGKSVKFDHVHRTKDGQRVYVEVNARALRLERKRAVMSIARDVTEKRMAEEALRASEDRYRTVISNSPIGIVTCDSSGRATFVNEALAEIIGATKEQVLGQNYHEIESWKVSGIYGKAISAVSNNRAERVDARVTTSFGRTVHLNCYFVPLGSGDLLVMMQDISEMVKAQEELRRSESYLASVIENEPECVSLFEPDGMLLDMNPSGLSMIEADDIGQVRGKKIHGIIAPEYLDEFINLTERVLGGGLAILKFKIVGLKGSEKWLEIHAVPFYDDKKGGTVILGVTRDITEQKIYEERLSRTLADKEFLIREVNHRVKNNLAVLQSLISMQARSVKDSMAKGCLVNVGNRIRTLILIHERLYKTEDVTRIEMRDYIASLAMQIYGSLVIDESAVRLRVDVSRSMIHMNYVIPCGLIVNELLTNALKYAFPLNEKGTVTVTFKEEREGQFTLSVKDTGIGLPEDFDIGKAEGLGMKVVESLVKQINGKMEIVSGKGTGITITFTAEPSNHMSSLGNNGTQAAFTRVDHK